MLAVSESLLAILYLYKIYNPQLYSRIRYLDLLNLARARKRHKEHEHS